MEYKDRQEWLRKDPNQEDPDPCYVWNGEKIPLKPRISDKDGNPINAPSFMEGEDKTGFDYNIKLLKDVSIKAPEWEVPGYIPKNQVTTIGGDGGSAKTSLWCSLLADVSNGHCSIFEKHYAGDVTIREPRKAMFFSSEDPVEEILKPKMQKYNANMDNIGFIDLKDERFPEIKFGSEFLDRIIEYHRPAFVVFDPIQSFIDERIQMGSRNAMRQCLNPLVGMCNKYNVTIILIAHANKAQGVWGRRRLADSSDLWDISRSVILNDKIDSNMFYASQEKNNYGPIEQTMLFSMENGILVPKGFTDKHDKEFQQARQYENRNSGPRKEAKEFILDWLKENGGKAENGGLTEAAEVIGISNNAMRNAKVDLKKEGKIKLENEGYGKDKKHYISLTAL